MATIAFPSPANTFSISCSKSTSKLYLRKCNIEITQPKCATLCKTSKSETSYISTKSPTLSKRSLALSFSSVFLLSLVGKDQSNAEAAVLEAEDDLELLEKVKNDRKKRIEKQVVINSSKKETGYLQDLVYKLSEVGQAIDNNDLKTASSVLGTATDNADWIQKANSAFSKLSSSLEEKSEVEEFNSSIMKLISSVVNKDVDSSKMAFVSSASALEKWTALTGLVDQLKGL